MTKCSPVTVENPLAFGQNMSAMARSSVAIPIFGAKAHGEIGCGSIGGLIVGNFRATSGVLL